MSTPLSKSIQDNGDYQLIHGAFPHIGKKLELLWGYPEFHTFVEQLQQDTRQGSRAGFPAAILFALLNLVQTHDELFPAAARSKSSFWSQSNFR